MSRNRSLREIANDLPVIYKRDRLGRPIFNEKGEQICVDHFREMTLLKQDAEAKMRKLRTQDIVLGEGMTMRKFQREYLRKEKIQMIGDYCRGVQKIHDVRRRRLLKRWLTAISIISIAVFIAIKYL